MTLAYWLYVRLLLIYQNVQSWELSATFIFNSHKIWNIIVMINDVRVSVVIQRYSCFLIALHNLGCQFIDVNASVANYVMHIWYFTMMQLWLRVITDWGLVWNMQNFGEWFNFFFDNMWGGGGWYTCTISHCLSIVWSVISSMIYKNSETSDFRWLKMPRVYKVKGWTTCSLP